MTRPFLSAKSVQSDPEFPSPQVRRVDRERRAARLGVVAAAILFAAATSLLLGAPTGRTAAGDPSPALAAP